MSATADVRRRTPRQRADALRNRERIVCAAREMFVEYGTDIALDEVARRAGIGNATVYRHFPGRSELLEAVLLQVMHTVEKLAECALAQSAAAGGDYFSGLRTFVHGVADEHIGAMCPTLSADFDQAHPDLATVRERIVKAVGALMARAREAGQLRDGVGAGDLLIALSQLTRPLPGITSHGVDRFVHRNLEVFLDGLMVPARSQLPGVPVTLEVLRDD